MNGCAPFCVLSFRRVVRTFYTLRLSAGSSHECLNAAFNLKNILHTAAFNRATIYAMKINVPFLKRHLIDCFYFCSSLKQKYFSSNFSITGLLQKSTLISCLILSVGLEAGLLWSCCLCSLRGAGCLWFCSWLWEQCQYELQTGMGWAGLYLLCQGLLVSHSSHLGSQLLVLIRISRVQFWETRDHVFCT